MDGSTYIGEFKDGKKSGHAIIDGPPKTDDESRFIEGTFDEKGKGIAKITDKMSFKLLNGTYTSELDDKAYHYTYEGEVVNYYIKSGKGKLIIHELGYELNGHFKNNIF